MGESLAATLHMAQQLLSRSAGTAREDIEEYLGAHSAEAAAWAAATAGTLPDHSSSATAARPPLPNLCLWLTLLSCRDNAQQVETDERHAAAVMALHVAADALRGSREMRTRARQGALRVHDRVALRDLLDKLRRLLQNATPSSGPPVASSTPTTCIRSG